MAMELQVQVRVVDTEPAEPGNPGVFVNSLRASTLTVDVDPRGEIALAGIVGLARARMTTLIAEVESDIDGQLRTAEENAKRQGFA